MVNFQTVWNWYSRESVQRAILEAAKNREVVSVFSDNSFGKRPNVLQYPSDILQAVAEGCVAFHGSVERWKNPMQLDVSMSRQDLDNLRTGWDLIFDPDVNDFEIAKIVVKQIVEALKDHGVKSYGIKYTGGKGFHIGIPFEALPEKINLRPTRFLYPEVMQKIIEYIKWYIGDNLKEELLRLGTLDDLSKRIGKPLSEIKCTGGLDPFKVVSIDVFGSRHLFRLPYSLHEKTLLVSLPLTPKKLERFKKEQANPREVSVEEVFLKVRTSLHDAEGLVVEALDWATKYFKQPRLEFPKVKKFVRTREISERYFPPCVKAILNGLSDGRKRSVFILINFLRNVGWKPEKIEKRLVEWNEKNMPPLRANYIRSQLRWHFRQERILLPPNCNNPQFYSDFGVCNPDEICGGDEGIKNPVNYPFKKMRRSGKLKIKRRR